MNARVRGAILVAAVAVPAGVLAQPAPDVESEGDDAAAEPAPADPPAPSSDAPGRPLPDTPPVPDEPAAAHAVRGFSWEPYGYLRLSYRAVQNDPNVEFVGRNDGFELQNARIGARGRLGERAAFVISIDGAVDEREQINTTEGKLRVGLRDAYADVALAGKVVARGGFFQSLLEPESLVPDTRRAFVDKPIESRGVRATEGYQTQPLTPDRSIGAALRLDPGVSPAAPRVGFELAVQNGAGEYASNNDNDLPAVSAAVLARFPNHGFVVAGARYNRRSVGMLPGLEDEDDLQISGGAQLEVGPISLGGGGVFVRTSFPTTGGPVQNAFGAHAQLLVGIPAAHLAVGYRFGILDPSSLIVTDRVMEHTAGGVFHVPRLRMRVHVQATHVVEQRALSNSRAQLAVEVAL